MEGNQSNTTTLPEDVRIALLSIYSLVFVIGGIASTATIFSICNTNVRSVTTMAVINLIMVHYLFLTTVPFRIYFYAVGYWTLNMTICRLVSAMIHGHMLVAFIFYFVILVIRDISFFKRTDKLEFYRKLHAVAVSAIIWGIIFGILFPLAFSQYGNSEANSSTCFNFGGAIKKGGVKNLNYALSSIVIITVLGLTGCQLYILLRVLRRHGRTAALQHQEFWAQMKSFLFIIVMLVCFFPYHVFRIYYVAKIDQENMQSKNEIFLAMTTLSCFDMLIFLGNCSCLKRRPTCCV